MSIVNSKAGDLIEVGTQKAYRFWRYDFPKYDLPVRLLSWVSDLRWYPRRHVEGTTPDVGEQGIHGYKTINDMMTSIQGLERLLIRSHVSGCDGVVLGTVEMWGTIWDHALGYRAQFARPTSFISSYGDRSEIALAELRTLFFGREQEGPIAPVNGAPSRKKSGPS